MGRFDVNTDPEEDDTLLVKFETRATRQGRNKRPRAEWGVLCEGSLPAGVPQSATVSGKSSELEFEPADCP